MKKLSKLLIALPFVLLLALTISAQMETEDATTEFPGEVEIIILDQSGDNTIGYVELE